MRRSTANHRSKNLIRLARARDEPNSTHPQEPFVPPKRQIKYEPEEVEAVWIILNEVRKSLCANLRVDSISSEEMRCVIMEKFDEIHPAGYDPVLSRHNVRDFLDKSKTSTPANFYYFKCFVDNPAYASEIRSAELKAKTRLSKTYKKAFDNLYFREKGKNVDFWNRVRENLQTRFIIAEFLQSKNTGNDGYPGTAIFKLGHFEDFTCEVDALYIPHPLRSVFPVSESRFEQAAKNTTHFSGYASCCHSHQPNTLHDRHSANLILNLRNESRICTDEVSGNISGTLVYFLDQDFGRDKLDMFCLYESGLLRNPLQHGLLKPREDQLNGFVTASCSRAAWLKFLESRHSHYEDEVFLDQIIENLEEFFKLFEGGYSLW